MNRNEKEKEPVHIPLHRLQCGGSLWKVMRASYNIFSHLIFFYWKHFLPFFYIFILTQQFPSSASFYILHVTSECQQLPIFSLIFFHLPSVFFSLVIFLLTRKKTLFFISQRRLLRKVVTSFHKSFKWISWKKM